MKLLLFLLLLTTQVFAQPPKDPQVFMPQWTVSIQFDHISFPSFGKYRPSAGNASFFKSWSISAARVIGYPDDNRGIYHQVYAGVLKNADLQKGFKTGIQSGFTAEGIRTASPLFQSGFDAGALILIERSRELSSSLKNMYPRLRLQWTGGLFMNAGAVDKRKSYTASAFSYKLWLQGPYIRKHAAALPHQSIGIAILY